MDWPNAVSLEFLELYKNEPVIWNPQHTSYKDRNLINEAWKRIKQSISVETSVMELKGKKESLMATFRKVSNKVKASDDDYRPPWFAYEFMEGFLNGIYTPRQSTTYKTLQYKSNKRHKEEDDENYEEDNEINEIPEVTSPVTNLEETIKPSVSAVNRKRKAWKMGKVGGTSEPYTVFKRTYKEPDKDQCTLYSELLAKKLRALDEKTRDFAMLEINNIMFCLKYQNNESDLSPCAHHSCSSWQNSCLCDNRKYICQNTNSDDHLDRMLLLTPLPS